MNKKAFTIYVLLSIVIIILSIVISSTYLDEQEKRLFNNKYTLLSKEIKNNINFLIEDKRTATLAFAIASSKSEKIKDAFLSKDVTKLNLTQFSKELKTQTKFRNVWFQLIDNKGNSIYRSWSNKKDDSLLFRDDVKHLIENKKIQNLITIGKFDITFNSMIPIFNDDTFIGIFEVITHFNSIAKILEESKSDVLVLANESYFNTITNPFTKKFIDKNYIANLNAKEYLIELIRNNGVENILKINDYKIINNYFLTSYDIKDFKNKIIAHIILAKNLKDIDISEIKNFKSNFIFNIIYSITILLLILVFIFYYIFSNKIILERKKSQQIIDSQDNIIIITDGETLQSANKQFLKFFNQYNSMEEFKKKHKCICEMFLDLEDDNYIIDKDYNGKNWAEHILANPQTSFKAAMKKGDRAEHFIINVNLTQFKGEDIPYVVVTLTNITSDIKQKSELKKLNNNLEHLVNKKTEELKKLNESLEQRVKDEIEKNKEKDRVLFEQNKMIAMREMLNNIAHQWRQPLSAISTSASSILLKKDMKDLDDESIDFLCNHILNSSNFLSKTIEDFRIFFKNGEDTTNFSLKESLINCIELIKKSFENNNINIVYDIKDDLIISSSKNQFQQAILNLIKNSAEALMDRKQDEKLIFITYSNSILNIYDNAKGIKKEIIEHIFEPYFTSKHKSQGKGLGLYMTKTILENNMNFKLDVQNTHFIHDGKDYFGANFTINFSK